ncbi:hypothetical protein L3Y34_019121 [Caenorhabditis briggsae]|uniref:Uncharacterized protein n=1 Tax=Caenorhabditis briggsae TaxID=6238 RepID=A0AAE9DM39_CAEBR|nr:hypothetical protein L3Y34_019121 [Caenorhabditis briggsae]
MFRIPPILLLLLSTFVHARDLGYFHGVVQGPKEILQNHLDIFQKALDAEEKATLMRMFPETEAPDESAVEILIIKHHNLKMEVIEAKREIAGQITGEVNYSRAGGGNEVFSVTIMTSAESPSGFKFFSVTDHYGQLQKRRFPTCLIGFIWCYLYLIDILPGQIG